MKWWCGSRTLLPFLILLQSAHTFTGQNSYCGRVDGGRTEPWSAVIFSRAGPEKGWTYAGEGALITNSTVLTSAEMFMSKVQRKLDVGLFHNYIVVLGLSSTTFPQQLDDLSDYSHVRYIRIHENALSSLTSSLAILHLRRELVYSPTVNEVCVPPPPENSGTSLLRPPDLVWMGGYRNNLDRPYLKAFDKAGGGGEENDRGIRSQLILREDEFCRERWKFFEKREEMPEGLQCASPHPPEGDWPRRCHRGTGVFVSEPPQDFLLGLWLKYFEVTQSTDISNCTLHSVYFFTQLTKHLGWIHKNIRCGASAFACTSNVLHKCVDLSQVCDGVRDCLEGEDEGTEICKAVVVGGCKVEEFSCGRPFGPCIPQGLVCDGKGDCPEGEDEVCHAPPPPCPDEKRRMVCPPLPRSQNTRGSCRLGGQPNSSSSKNYSCSLGGYLGSKMRIECDPFYISKEEVSSLEVECLKTGQWFPHPQFSCKIDCGRGDAVGIHPLIVNGWGSSVSTWPWHGILCYKTTEGTDCICGVTLISDSVVLTAAHCLPTNNQGRVDPKAFEVVLGTTTADYDTLSQNKSSVQRFQVNGLAISNRFNPRSFEGDIAVIHLSRKVRLSNFVRPVCFPFPGEKSLWLETYQLVPGVIGFVPGFGLDEKGELPSGLRALGLPYISHADCSSSLNRTIFPSQFCAGYKNGSATCNGDSGGGLVFSQGTGLPSLFYIQGIVSNSEPLRGTWKCNHQNYAVFTKVSSFANWIQEQMNRFNLK